MVTIQRIRNSSMDVICATVIVTIQNTTANSVRSSLLCNAAPSVNNRPTVPDVRHIGACLLFSPSFLVFFVCWTHRTANRRRLIRMLHMAMVRQADGFVACEWGCRAWVRPPHYLAIMAH